MMQFLKNLLLKDLAMKLAALGLAVALWATVTTMIDKTERERGVVMNSNKLFQGLPVSVVSGRGDVSRYRVSPETVNVFVQGTPDAIEALDMAAVKAVVDLTDWDGRAGQPAEVWVLTPRGTAVVRVSPPEVNVIPPEPDPTPAPIVAP